MKKNFLLLVLMGAGQNNFGASSHPQADRAQVVGMHVLKNNQGYYTHNFEGNSEDLSKKDRNVFAIHFLKEARYELLDGKSKMVCYEVKQPSATQDVKPQGAVEAPLEGMLMVKKSSLILMLSLATRKKIRKHLKQNDGITFSAEVPCDYADLANHKFGASTSMVFRSMCMNLHDCGECCIQ